MASIVKRCVGILLAVSCILPIFVSPAYAADSDEGKVELDSSYIVAPEQVTGEVYVLVAPGLSWQDITASDTPTLYALAGTHACANVVVDAIYDLSVYQGAGNFHYAQLNGYSLQEIDEYVSTILQDMGSADSLVITASPAFAQTPFEARGYTPTIVADAGDNGLLTSTTTTRSGLITSSDLNGAICALVQVAQRHPGAVSVYGLSNFLNTTNRVSTLSHADSVALAIQDSKPYYFTFFVLLMGLTFALSITMTLLEIKIRPTFLNFLIPVTRILWVVAIAFPLASYLMFVQLPPVVTPTIALCFCFAWLAALSFIALLIGFMCRWLYSLLFLFLITAVTLIGDQLLGGPLTACGYLSYSPLDITRYYGIGNEGASLMFGSWIMLSALLMNRFPDRAFIKPFKLWIFPLVSVFVITVIAAPWWGSNFGVLIWGSVGAIVAWLLFNERKVTWKAVAVMVVVSALLACSVLFLDTTFNAESHMGAQMSSLNGGWFRDIFLVVCDMVRLSWNTVVFSPFLAACFLFIFFYLIWLRVAKPGPYAQFWKRNIPFKAAYVALLITSGLMLFTEDSGIFMPALLLLYAMAGFIWLVCDLHRWHLREWARTKHNIDISRLQSADLLDAELPFLDNSSDDADS